MRYGVIVNPTSGKNTGAQIGLDAVGRLRPRARRSWTSLRSTRPGRLPGARGHREGGDRHLGRRRRRRHGAPGYEPVRGHGGALGIIAAGTGNDIARELGLPVRDAAKSVERILAGRTRAVDAVRHERPTGESAWFVGVIAAGFDAIVNERANGWRWPKGRLRYDLAIMRELPVFRPIPYVLELDGERIETEAMLVAVGNGPAYGGGMQVVPDARFDDGVLDVLILRKISIPEFLRVFPRVRTGGHVSHPAVEIRQARSVRLEATGIVSYADGERFAPLPIGLDVVPGALTVLA